MFYFGGSHTLRSVPANTRGGTGMAVARLDLIGTTDVLQILQDPFRTRA